MHILGQHATLCDEKRVCRELVSKIRRPQAKLQQLWSIGLKYNCRVQHKMLFSFTAYAGILQLYFAPQLKYRAVWCSYTWINMPLQVELQVEAIHVISRAEPLPFEVIDASRGDEEVAAAAAKGELLVTVNRDTRLDSRFVDLRTPANQAVFQLQSGVCQVCYFMPVCV